MSDCSLCKVPILPILWSDHNFRIVLVTDQNIKGYLRLEALEHVSEIYQLSASIRQQMFSLLNIIEINLVNIFHPDKINIASLGNMAPHVHWHIICECSTMARIDPQHLSWVLENLVEHKIVNEIVVPPSIAQSAKVALDRMLTVV